MFKYNLIAKLITNCFFLYLVHFYQILSSWSSLAVCFLVDYLLSKCGTIYSDMRDYTILWVCALVVCKLDRLYIGACNSRFFISQ